MEYRLHGKSLRIVDESDSIVTFELADEEPGYITVQTAADITGYSLPHVYYLTRVGKLEHERDGSRIKIALESLDDLA